MVLKHYVWHGLAIRLTMIWIGTTIDQYSRLHYTDIDYSIYTNAAKTIQLSTLFHDIFIINVDNSSIENSIQKNIMTTTTTIHKDTNKIFVESINKYGNPYSIPTYRYSPFLAFLLIPNYYFHSFGKIIFSIFDACIGYIITITLSSSSHIYNLSDTYISNIAFIWAMNPITIIIATRGSCDSISNFLFLYSIYLLIINKILLSGLMHGILIHFRLVHIIYFPAIFLYILRQNTTTNIILLYSYKQSNKIFLIRLWNYVYNLQWRYSLLFVCTCITMCGILTIASYLLYPNDYINTAILYHLNRYDFKHNFSALFYPLYLAYDSHTDTAKYVSFIPQVVLLVISAVTLANKRFLYVCLFIQTLCFVTYNKVCTAQYFTWYICLVPFISHNLTVSNLTITFAIIWCTSLALWLFLAYLLEFQGLNTFIEIWMAGLLFHIANVALILHVLQNVYCKSIKSFN